MRGHASRKSWDISSEAGDNLNNCRTDKEGHDIQKSRTLEGMAAINKSTENPNLSSCLCQLNGVRIIMALQYNFKRLQ